MRIEANGVNSSRLNGVDSGLDTRSSDRVGNGGPRTTSPDEISLSSTGNDVLVATRAISELPDVREDKIADIKARIQAGQYNPSPEEIAAKIIGS
jgi:negative regulator of flagellin synthesis FlgM